MSIQYLVAFLLVFHFLISSATSKGAGAGDGSKSDLLRQVNRGDTGKHDECSSSANVSANCISHQFQFNASNARKGSPCEDVSDCKKIAKEKGVTEEVGCATSGKYQDSECIYCNISSDARKGGYSVDGCGLGPVAWAIIGLILVLIVGAIIALISCMVCKCCPLYKYRMARRNRQVQPGTSGFHGPGQGQGQGGQGYATPYGGHPGAGQNQSQRPGPGHGPGGQPSPFPHTPSPSASPNPGPIPSPSSVVNPKSSTISETEEQEVSELPSKGPSKKGKKSKSTKTKSKKEKGKKSKSPKKKP